MDKRYWYVRVRYGHVKLKKEVSVARHIVTERSASITDVLDIIAAMPGVKYRGGDNVFEIDRDTYERGKELECENIYLQKLMNYSRNKGGINYAC